MPYCFGPPFHSECNPPHSFISGGNPAKKFQKMEVHLYNSLFTQEVTDWLTVAKIYGLSTGIPTDFRVCTRTFKASPTAGVIRTGTFRLCLPIISMRSILNENIRKYYIYITIFGFCFLRACNIYLFIMFSILYNVLHSKLHLPITILRLHHMTILYFTVFGAKCYVGLKGIQKWWIIAALTNSKRVCSEHLANHDSA